MTHGERNAIMAVFSEITDRRETLITTLARAGAKSFEEYHGLCGEIQGLSRAQQLLTDLVRVLENADE